MEILEEIEHIGKNLICHGTTQKEVSIQDLNHLYSHGYSLFEAGKYHEAIDVFQTLVTLCPFHTDALLSLGLTQFKVKDFESAKKPFEVYSLLKPSCYEGYLYQGYLEIEKGNHKTAITFLEKSLVSTNLDEKQRTTIELVLERIKKA